MYQGKEITLPKIDESNPPIFLNKNFEYVTKNIIKDNDLINYLDRETMISPGKYAFVSEMKIYECVGKKLLQNLEDQKYIDFVIQKVG